MLRSTFSLILVTAVLSCLVGCGPKPRTSESILDSPEYHFNQGLTQLDNKNFAGAEYSFQKALELDRDFAPAIAGSALVLAQKDSTEDALHLADKAISKNDDLAFPWAARGRVRSIVQDGANWMKKADSDFGNAIEREPGDDRFLFWWGQAKAWAYDFDGSAELFENVIAHKGAFTARADEEYAYIQTIQRAAPGTKVGLRIALLKEVTRADLAALFVEELKLQQIYEKLAPEALSGDFISPGQANIDNSQSSSMSYPTDVENHWAKSWIDQTLRFHVIELYPDGTFRPNLNVSRGEYAMILQNILSIVEHDKSLTSRYLTENSRFIDMSAGTAAYNAAALVVDRNLMDASINGQFEPTSTVTGAEALMAIRNLQNLLRIDF